VKRFSKTRWFGTFLSICAVALIGWITLYGVGAMLIRGAQTHLEGYTKEHVSDPNRTVSLPAFEVFVKDAEKIRKLDEFSFDPRLQIYWDDRGRSISSWSSDELGAARACLSDHADILAEIERLANEFEQLPEQRLQFDRPLKTARNYSHLVYMLEFLTDWQVFEGNLALAEDYILLIFAVATRMDEINFMSGSIGCRKAFNTLGAYLQTTEPSPEFLPKLESALKRFPDQMEGLPEFLRASLVTENSDTAGYGSIFWNGALAGLPEVVYDSPVGLPARQIDQALAMRSSLAFVREIEKAPLETWRFTKQRKQSGRTPFGLPQMEMSSYGILAYAETAIETQARINILLTVIEIEKFKEIYNRYPATIDELPNTLPKDPFSNEPLIYSSSSLLLYSRGKNCVDDHGKEDDIRWRGFREDNK